MFMRRDLLDKCKLRQNLFSSHILAMGCRLDALPKWDQSGNVCSHVTRITRDLLSHTTQFDETLGCCKVSRCNAVNEPLII